MGRTMRYSTNKPSTLLRFLCERFSYLDETQWRRHATAGFLSVNGAVVADPATHHLKSGDVITFDPPRELEPAVDARYVTLFEDEHIVVVRKSGNLPVSEGGRYSKNTLCSIVGEEIASRGGSAPLVLLPVHRLDKETSGLVVMAKTPQAADALSRQFESKTVAADSCGGGGGSESAVLPTEGVAVSKLGKVYHAILVGEMPNPGQPVTCRQRVGFASEASAPSSSASPSAACNLSRLRMAAFPAESALGKHALSFVTPLRVAAGLTLAEIRIVTGRSHQIRVHTAALGFPVLGDKLYGTGDCAAPTAVSDELYLKRARGEVDVVAPAGFVVPRQLLHAASLTFLHPESGREMHFESAGLDMFAEEVPQLKFIFGSSAE